MKIAIFVFAIVVFVFAIIALVTNLKGSMPKPNIPVKFTRKSFFIFLAIIFALAFVIDSAYYEGVSTRKIVMGFKSARYTNEEPKTRSELSIVASGNFEKSSLKVKVNPSDLGGGNTKLVGRIESPGRYRFIVLSGDNESFSDCAPLFSSHECGKTFVKYGSQISFSGEAFFADSSGDVFWGVNSKDKIKEIRGEVEIKIERIG
jgi:hypothetical protein